MGFFDDLKNALPDFMGFQDEAYDPKKKKEREKQRKKDASRVENLTVHNGKQLRRKSTVEDLIIDPNTNRQVTERTKASEIPQADPMSELLEALNQKYSGTMPGYDDSESMAALDAALGNTLQGIQGLRDTTNQNFQLSDSNLQSMHSAYQNDIQTNGSAAYNKISDDLVNNLNAGTTQATGQLTQMEDESRNKRAAMLKSLGIEEAAGAPESTVLEDAKQNLVSRNNTDQTAAQETRATNQAYNTGLAQSVGSAGVERRSELQRQLNQAMGTIDAKEMDARTQYQNQKAGLAAQKAGSQNDRASFEYGMYQDEQDGLRQMLDAFSQGGEEASPVKTSGYAGLAQDLTNSGIDQQTASQALKAHADVIASEDYLKARQRGQDPIAYTVGQLTKKGIPVAVAVQIATNYNNLGSTSAYTAMQ